MIHGLRVLPSADLDVDGEAYFLAAESVEAALRFCDAVFETYKQIAKNPRIYARFPFRSPRLAEIRKCQVNGFPNMLVFYRMDSDMVEILHVVHGSRDLHVLFDDD